MFPVNHAVPELLFHTDMLRLFAFTLGEEKKRKDQGTSCLFIGKGAEMGTLYA